MPREIKARDAGITTLASLVTGKALADG